MVFLTPNLNLICAIVHENGGKLSLHCSPPSATILCDEYLFNSAVLLRKNHVSVSYQNFTKIPQILHNISNILNGAMLQCVHMKKIYSPLILINKLNNKSETNFPNNNQMKAKNIKIV